MLSQFLGIFLSLTLGVTIGDKPGNRFRLSGCQVGVFSSERLNDLVYDRLLGRMILVPVNLSIGKPKVRICPVSHGPIEKVVPL
jgi:hypothetical protein